MINETDLFIRLKETNDAEEIQTIKDYLISKHSNLVKSISIKRYKYSGRTNRISLEDVVNNGYIGFLKAIDKFDINAGTKFITFAYFHIENEVRRIIDKNQFTISVERKVVQASRKIASLLEDGIKTKEEIRCEIDLSDDLFLHAYNLYKCGTELSTFSFDDEEENPFVPITEPDTKPKVNDDVMSFITKNFNEVETSFLRMYLGFEEENLYMNIPKISKRLGLRGKEVKELEDKLIPILKQFLLDCGYN